MDKKGLACQKGVVKDQFPDGKEAKDGSVRFVPRWRRLAGTAICTSPRCFPQDRIQKAFGTARWLWQGWIYTPAVTVWVFLSQCLSPDHSCRDAVARLIAWRVARGLKPCSAETGAYCTARNDLPEEAVARIGARHGQAGRGRIARDLALAWAKGPRGGRLDRHHARHAGESGGLSADEIAEARLRLSHRPNPGDLFALGGHRVGGGDRQVQGEADGRKQLVSRASPDAGRRRRGAGGPLFQRLVRYCAAAATRRRHRGSQASTPAHGLSHGQAVGQGRSSGCLVPAATADVDVGRAVRHAARGVDVARDPHSRRPTRHAHEVAAWW